MTLYQRLMSLFFLLPLLLGSGVCLAGESPGSSQFRLSGFGTLALTSGGDEELGFRRDLAQEGLFDGDWSLRPDSLVGIQADFQATERFSGAVQLVGKDRVNDSLENSLEWAFLRYRFNADWTARIGRIGFDLFMLSDYRNVGFAYLWTRPPIEFYTPVSFNSFDGADLAWSTTLGDGTLRAKVMIATSKSTISVLNTSVDIKLETIVGGTINWESEHLQLRFSVSDNKLGEADEYFPSTEVLGNYLLLASPIWPEAAGISELLKVGDSHIQYYALGAAYNKNAWQIQSEISFFDSQMDIYPASFNGYLSVGYQLGPVTPFIMYAFMNTQEDPVTLPASPVFPSNPGLTEQLALLREGAQLSFDSTRADQNTLSLGARWDIRYDMAVKAQWDYSRVSAYGAGLWDQRNISGAAEEQNTFSINLNFIF